jgi:hypothetical protein
MTEGVDGIEHEVPTPRSSPEPLTIELARQIRYRRLFELMIAAHLESPLSLVGVDLEERSRRAHERVEALGRYARYLTVVEPSQ